MSKKARKNAPARNRFSVQRGATILAGLQEAKQLLRRGRPQEALSLLHSLDQLYPNDEDVLALLVSTYFDLEDIRSYQRYVERLLAIRKDDPDMLLALAGAYAINLYPALAVQTFRQFLERYPSHSKARGARQSLVELEATLDKILSTQGLAGADRFELAMLHDRIGIALDTGDFAQGRKAAQLLFSRAPTFIPAHNNLSLMDFAQGKPQQAIERARYVLTLEPDNFQALGNLVRYLALTGQTEEAQRRLQELLAIDKEDMELVWKQAETLAYLGEDQALLEVDQRAKALGYHKPPLANPILHHLTAVAALRLGNEQQARDLWRQALKLNHNFELASNNLADLAQPVGQRQGPWSFPFQQWVPQQTRDDALKQWQHARNSRWEDANRQATLRLLGKHPELVILIGILLDRGDPRGREFALEFALSAQTPELLRVVHDFALGQRGPDEMRARAARAVSNAGLLPAEPVRLWIQGRWQEVILHQFEVTWEPLNPLPSPAGELLVAATEALQKNRPKEAERLLLQVLEFDPDEPKALNNLAMAYERQGRKEEALTLIQRVHEEHPDYLFGIITMANLATSKGAFDEAAALLQPLIYRPTLHISEFENLCMTYIQLGLASKDRPMIESWLNTWKSVDGDSDTCRQWQIRVKHALLTGGR